MTKHTKEPWRVGALESGMFAVDGSNGEEVTGFTSQEDACRIVACVNACEGISTKNLEDNVPFLELARRYNVVLRERDALRAKIEAMEKQEPVAQVGVHKTGGNAGIAWSARPLNEFDSLPPLCDGDKLYLNPGAQPAPSALAEAIIADMQAQHDSELITENDSGEALIRLDGAIAAVEDNFALAQPAPIIPEGWKLVPTAESRHPGIYKMLGALHTVDNTPGASEWESYAAFLAAAPEAKP